MRPVWLALVLLGCSGGSAKDSAGTSDDPYRACSPKGSLSGCEVYESTDCQGNTALDGLDGGWFDDSGGSLVIGLDQTTAGSQVRLTVPDAAGLTDGSEYSIPTEVLVELTDRDGTLYYACAGTLRITNYTPGELLWANGTFQARGPMGICGETDFWSIAIELVNAEVCKG